MKTISTLIAMSAFLTTAAFAQDHIKCELKIPDNNVGCFISLINCPEKELKESNKEIHFNIHDGEQLSGSIKLNHVVLHPGTKKQDKNQIFLFEEDLRHEKLRDEKNVDLVAYEAEHGIDYLIRKEGPFIKINFQSPSMKLNFNAKGDFIINDYLLTPASAISLKCTKVNKEVFEAGERKRKAIEEHLKTKKEKEQQSGEARQE